MVKSVLKRTSEIAADTLGLGRDLFAETRRLEAIASDEDRLKVSMLSKPLNCGLRTDTAQARDVVDGVSDEGEIVRDAFRWDAKFLGHARCVEATPGWGRAAGRRRCKLDDGPANALSKVLVGTDDDHLVASCRESLGGGGNQVVRLNPSLFNNS